LSEWFLYREDVGIVGPVDSALVLEGIEDGRVPTDMKVRGVADTSWRSLSQIPIFALAVRTAPTLDPALRRPLLDGFGDAAAAAEQAHSIRPHVREAAARSVSAGDAPAARFGVPLGIASGAVLGILAAVLAARSIRSMPGQSPDIARASLTSTFQHVSAALAPAVSVPEPVAEATSQPASDRPAKKQKRAPHRAPSKLDQPGF